MVDDAQHGECKTIVRRHQRQVQRPGVVDGKPGWRLAAHGAPGLGYFVSMFLNEFGYPGFADGFTTMTMPAVEDMGNAAASG